MINNKAYSFSTDTLSIIQSNCPHDSQIPIKNEFMNCSEWHFVFADLEQLNIPIPNHYGFISSNHELVTLFKLIYSEMEMQYTNYQSIVINILKAIVDIANREAENIDSSNFDDVNPELVNVINYILHCYYEPITVESLAQKCNLSVSTFCRSFMKYTGSSPMSFVNHTRLTIAKNMLVTSNLSILEISESVGFNTLSSFNRLFLKENGYPPKEMRKSKNKTSIDNTL